MLRSLSGRLLLSYAFIIAICLVVVTLALLVLLRPISERAQLTELTATAAAHTAYVEGVAQGGRLNFEQSRRLVRLGGQRAQARTLLLDEHFEVLFDSGPAGGAGPEGRLVGAKLSALWSLDLARGAVRGGTFGEPGYGDWTFALAPWPRGSANPARYAVYARPVERFPLWALVRDRFIPQVALAGLIALGLSIVLAYLIARSVVGPLQALAAGARAVARGEYGHTVPVGGPVEVRELATTFNRMSQQVRAGQQAQRDFVANVSHELRTPLTSIQGFSQAILDGAAGEPQAVAHAAGIIHAEAQRLRRMADDLLELARLDAGQITLRREPVELAALLRACAERLEPRAREAGVALALELPAGLPGVIGDGDRLAQVFTNLLDNALQHTPAGGQVTLSAAAATGGVVVRVRDSGRGIPADDLARIFERFYQVDKSRRRAQGGAGLGLAIVRELVQAHGGAVSAESAEGLGTTFLVTLPARS
jgi:signal transduction histidine kinase